MKKTQFMSKGKTILMFFLLVRDTLLVNNAPFKEGSKPNRQNTQLEYDITLQDLPEHMTTNKDLLKEVKHLPIMFFSSPMTVQ